MKKSNKISELVDRYGFIVYPILFALFPILSFYSANASDLRTEDSQMASFIVLNLVVLGLCWPLAYLATRNFKKASLLAVGLLVIFFSFGRVHSQLNDLSISTPVTLLGPTKVLLLTSLIFLIGLWFGVRKLSDKAVKTASVALLAVGSYLVVSSLFSIAASALSDNEKQSSESSSSQIGSIDQAKVSPDIYYILLDGYGRADYLQSAFNHDNSDFLNELKSRGFYVAEKANSNYAHTHLSVPSTFNMKYLNYLSEEVGKESNNREPLKQLTHYNEVVNSFKDMGYKYVNIGTQWGWSKSSPIDDIELIADSKTQSSILGIDLNESALVYLQTTALKPWIESTLRGTMLAQVSDAVEKLDKVPGIQEPTLTFAHFLLPHPPYIFDRNGPIKGQTQLELDNHGFSDREEFVEQTIYTNKLTLELVDKIIKNSSQPPIIIVASDHGPASSLSPSEFQETDPANIDSEGVKERMAILNAYYFPDGDYSKLYPSISPVNSFRVVFSKFFEKDLDLLPDQSYLSDNKKDQYLFTDVTELVGN